VIVSAVVLRGSFHHVEHILMGLATVFVAYIAAGFLGGPDWAQALHGLVVPTMPLTRTPCSSPPPPSAPPSPRGG
jgi:hypothetical protein